MKADDPPVDPHGFGRRVREARAAAGLSQGELAAAVKSSKRTVEKWENGSLPRAKLPTIAATLGVSVQWLIDGKETAADELVATRREIVSLRDELHGLRLEQREGFASLRRDDPAVTPPSEEVWRELQELRRLVDRLIDRDDARADREQSEGLGG